MTKTQRHFTAWLVNNPHCLYGPNCDVTVLEDMLIGSDPQNEDNWGTDSSKPRAFFAVTGVDAKEGDAQDAIKEAEKLLADAGWCVVTGWEASTDAYTATVKRD